MPKTLVEMAKELVAELIRVHQLSSDDTQSLLSSTHATLLGLHQVEVTGLTATSFDTPGKAEAGWKRSINQHAIICLECGESFKQLSNRHLRVHGIDAKAYRRKHRIPSTQPLSSRQATARRREVAKAIRPWEQAASKRAEAKGQAKRPTGRRRGTA